MIKDMHFPAFENLLEKLGTELDGFGFETNFLKASEDQSFPMLEISVLTEDDFEDEEEMDDFEDEELTITAQLFIAEVPNAESPDFINLQLIIPVRVEYDDLEDEEGDDGEEEMDNEALFNVLVALPHINNFVPYGYFSMMPDNSLVFRATIPGLLTEEFNADLVNGVLDSAFFAVYEYGDILRELADNEITLDEAMTSFYEMKAGMFDLDEDFEEEEN